MLRAVGIKKVFKDGKSSRIVLHQVDLELAPGEVTALMGKSGSGKSTLLHILGLLEPPSGGEVWCDGVRIDHWPERRKAQMRRSRTGFVFQQFFLLPELTVRENLLLAAQMDPAPWVWWKNRARALARSDELLAQVGLCERAHNYPPTLSGGERQRVALARALMNQPRVLFCDEPTGNLDQESGAHIIDLLMRLGSEHGLTVLVATHDVQLARQAGRAFKLEQGRLVAL
jgi:lipoprotein-releasing system ATP-binding protein